MGKATYWQGMRDFRLEVAKGNVAGHTLLSNIGHNGDVGTAAYEDVWYAGGTYPFLTVAATVRVKAGGNAADDAGGAGARTILVQGLDENFALAEDTLTTNGVDVGAAGTVTFSRVYRAYVLTCGAYGGSNTGDVLIETTGGTTVAALQAGMAQSQIAIYTVPAGHTAYMFGFRIEVDTNKNAEIKLSQRNDVDTIAAPFRPFRLVSQLPGVVGIVPFDLSGAPIPFAEKTDIRFEALANTNPAAVTVEFDLFIVQNDILTAV